LPWFNIELQKRGRNWDQLKDDDQFEISESKRGPMEYFNLSLIGYKIFNILKNNLDCVN